MYRLYLTYIKKTHIKSVFVSGRTTKVLVTHPQLYHRLEMVKNGYKMLNFFYIFKYLAKLYIS